uniref:Uncharacterized protein n=1 Tax=Moniliophthora roreri TaxID=221103 RepID=A0A0W0G188_MONRR
MLPLSLMMQGL